MAAAGRERAPSVRLAASSAQAARSAGSGVLKQADGPRGVVGLYEVGERGLRAADLLGELGRLVGQAEAFGLLVLVDECEKVKLGGLDLGLGGAEAVDAVLDASLPRLGGEVEHALGGVGDGQEA